MDAAERPLRDRGGVLTYTVRLKRERRSRARHWPTSGRVVVGVSLAYLIAGVYWSVGGTGFPFGAETDPLGTEGALGSLTAAASPWLSVVAAAGLVVAMLMVRWRSVDAVGIVLLCLAWVQALALTLVVPDGRVLIAVTHIPILIVGLPFGWPPGVTIASQLPWPVVNQAILMALGVAWALFALWFMRRARGACGGIRRRSTHAWSRPENAARWGRWAVVVAMVPPAAYAVTRYAWAFGIPLGVSSDFMNLSDDDPGIFIAGGFMATIAVLGGVLTLGLTQRWGEVYPRWLPFVGGRPVRPAVAIVPATAVALLLTNAGINWLRAMALNAFPPGAMSQDWATTAPGALFGIWGVALGIATYAYALRRRGRCSASKATTRGEEERSMVR